MKSTKNKPRTGGLPRIPK